MATVHYANHNGRWRVRWFRTDGKRVGRQVATREEAERIAASITDERPRRSYGGPPPRTRDEVVARLAEMSALDDTGCMIWQGQLSNTGYPKMAWKQADGSVLRGGHRIAYHALVAPVVPGLVIDHLCRTPACVRPDHLDLVTPRENIMRSPIAPGALNAAKTHCPQGHPYDEANTLWQTHPNGTTRGRVCRACLRNRSRRNEVGAA